MRLRLVLLAVLALGLSLGSGQARAQAEAEGRVLGPNRGQVAWLDLSGAPAEPLTAIARPAYPADVSAAAGVPFAVSSIISPFRGGTTYGADLATVDLESGAVTPLLARETEAESLDVPALWPDGSAVVYQRSLIVAEAPNYRTRIERIAADGSNRTTLIDGGRSPAPSPDGSRLAFVRVADAGASLVVRESGDARESVIVPTGNFVAIAYPRFSPDGQQLAFAAITQIVAPFRGASGSALIGSALGHGFPYEVWMVGVDGQALRQVPDVLNDDPSIAWSPDGGQILVYGGWGGQLVDLASGASESLPSLIGYGATSWLPN